MGAPFVARRGRGGGSRRREPTDAVSRERYGDRTLETAVDGEEVTVVGDEIACRRLLVVRDDLDRGQATLMGIRDQRWPLRVDIELHCANRARALQDLGEGRHRLIIGCDVDEVAAAVDARPG